MAQRVRRVNSGSERRIDTRQLRYTYEDGSAVRKPEWIPPEQGGRSDKTQTPQRQKKRSSQQKAKQTKRAQTRNRTRNAAAGRVRAEQRLGVGYVLFLTAVCAVTVLFCIYFLQLKSELTTQSAKIVALESNLAQLQADNDAYYKKAMASVTMDEVRETAIDKLGMHYPSESQIRYYSTDDSSYVRQYRNVP